MFDCHFLESYNQKRCLEKGHTLAYQFEQMMELGDASNEEAPPACSRNQVMSKYSWLQMTSMLQRMLCNDGLWRGQSPSSPKGSMWHAAQYID